MEGEVGATEELSSIIQIGAISFDEKYIIGRSLATVFKGTLNGGKTVAVKRIEVKNQAIETSEDRLMELKGSPNIVHLFHVEKDRNFR